MIIILRLYLYIYVCVLQLTLQSQQKYIIPSIRSAVVFNGLYKTFCGFNYVHEMNRWSQKLTVMAGSMLQQSLLQLYLISSCDLIAIAFKQDELCFHVLVCYQRSSESGETAIVSCKNCHNFITERFQKKPVLYFDPCIISHLLSSNVVSSPEILFIHRQTDRQTEHQITVTLCSAYAGED